MGHRSSVGRLAVNDRIRSHLTAVLAKKVEAHGIVVWDDPATEYGLKLAVAAVPPDVTLEVFDGSWFELRHRIERLLGESEPPRLILYVDGRAPEEDPLMEVRSAGTSFTIRLATLVQQALRGQLTEGRLRDIGQKARTLLEAEAAVYGDGHADPRLVAALGSSDVHRMAIAALTGERDTQIDQAGVWAEVAAFLGGTAGASFDGARDELRRSAFRHLILAELSGRLGGLPDHIAPSWERPTPDQCQSAAEILNAWRADRDRIKSYVRSAVEADGELALASSLAWSATLSDLDSLPSLEAVAMREALRRLSERDFGSAGALARERLERSLWAGDAAGSLEVPDWGPRWEVLTAIADLRAALAAEPPPSGGASELLQWYATSGWTVDRAHRKLETRSGNLSLEGELESEIAEARSSYEQWLDRLLQGFTASVAGETMESGQIMLQAHVHERLIAGVKDPTAYVWVDALRYELGMELADRLRPRSSSIEVRPAVAALPSITPVGMANLCPGAEGGLGIELQRGRITVRIGGAEVKDASARVQLLRVAHGPVEDLSLSRLLAQGEKRLGEKLIGKPLAIVRSQEIDAAGESGMLATSWRGFEDMVQQLERAAARLAQAGFRRLVIAADHGFVALSRPLGQDRRADAPVGGKGELHARAWVGQGGIDTRATVRIPLSSVGVRSDLDLLCPAHLAVFRGSWTGQFFHGGVSPQEMLIPVIVADLQPPARAESRQVEIEVAGGRLTSGVFSCTVTVPGQGALFDEPVLRLLVRKVGEAGSVARIFRGEGYDPAADVVRLRDGSASLTFRVTANLGRHDEVEVMALDATTDQKLGSALLRVAAPILIEEDLG